MSLFGQSQTTATVKVGGYIYSTPEANINHVVKYCAGGEKIIVVGRCQYNTNFFEVKSGNSIGFMFYSDIKEYGSIVIARPEIDNQSKPENFENLQNDSSPNIKVIHLEKMEGGTYEIPCKVNGLQLKFIFDTGASDVSISLTEALFMLKNGYLSEEDFTGTQSYQTASGEILEGTTIRINKLEFEGLTLYNIDASIVNEMKAPLLLGQSALSKLGRIQIDYQNNTLTIFK